MDRNPSSLTSYAQRRPGHAPRRHARAVSGSRPPRSLNEGRGTHPGDTLGHRPRRTPTLPAQGRPGHAPRRHAAHDRDAHPADHPLNEGRGTHPGDTAATTACEHASPTLNEGRGTHPGDTGGSAHERDGRRRRSTKAGARTPATHLGPRVVFGDRQRSTKAGARTPATLGRWVFIFSATAVAQRRPGHAPRRHAPWPTAGTAAAYVAQRRPGHAPRRHALSSGAAPPRARPLNEGRGTHPGDTPRGRRGQSGLRPLNEGRGTHPGDTCSRRRSTRVMGPAQRRPGHAPRRHTPRG